MYIFKLLVKNLLEERIINFTVQSVPLRPIVDRLALPSQEDPLLPRI